MKVSKIWLCVWRIMWLKYVCCCHLLVVACWFRDTVDRCVRVIVHRTQWCQRSVCCRLCWIVLTAMSLLTYFLAWLVRRVAWRTALGRRSSLISVTRFVLLIGFYWHGAARSGASVEALIIIISNVYSCYTELQCLIACESATSSAFLPLRRV